MNYATSLFEYSDNKMIVRQHLLGYVLKLVGANKLREMVTLPGRFAIFERLVAEKVNRKITINGIEKDKEVWDDTALRIGPFNRDWGTFYKDFRRYQRMPRNGTFNIHRGEYNKLVSDIYGFADFYWADYCGLPLEHRIEEIEECFDNNPEVTHFSTFKLLQSEKDYLSPNTNIHPEIKKQMKRGVPCHEAIINYILKKNSSKENFRHVFTCRYPTSNRWMLTIGFTTHAINFGRKKEIGFNYYRYPYEPKASHERIAEMAELGFSNAEIAYRTGYDKGQIPALKAWKTIRNRGNSEKIA